MPSLLPSSWPRAQAWKTAFAASQAFAARCEALRQDGAAAGAILEGLLLAAYDHAASAFGPELQWSRFMNMHWFGAAGLRSLPGHGASVVPPEWSEIFDLQRAGNTAFAAVWNARNECLRAGFAHDHIADALLRCAGSELRACREDAQRYWFRQFAERGERAAELARRPVI